MIEFGDGPAHEQMHELFQETTVLLTMLTHPHLHDEVDASRQAERTYALSPAYALVVLASIGAGRAWRLARAAADGGGASAQFPRGVLQTVPNGRRPDLLLLAIDLVQAVADGARVRPLVEQLLADGVRAYRVLLAVVHELGWLAARADPDVRTVVELVALEPVTAERDWYANDQTL